MSFIYDPQKWRLSKSGYTIRTGWADEKKFIAKAPVEASDADGFNAWLENAAKICELYNARLKPIDMVLFCPECGQQHIDEAAPDKCETCGGGRTNCSCEFFTEWLNPPHKSHRCHNCNHVWRPANIPTNGVKELEKC